MPLAKGVSVKPTVWDFQGNNGAIDLPRMMAIVVDAGYHGYCGIEHGPEGQRARRHPRTAPAARSGSRSTRGEAAPLRVARSKKHVARRARSAQSKQHVEQAAPWPYPIRQGKPRKDLPEYPGGSS